MIDEFVDGILRLIGKVFLPIVYTGAIIFPVVRAISINRKKKREDELVILEETEDLPYQPQEGESFEGEESFEEDLLFAHEVEAEPSLEKMHAEQNKEQEAATFVEVPNSGLSDIMGGSLSTQGEWVNEYAEGIDPEVLKREREARRIASQQKEMDTDATYLHTVSVCATDTHRKKQQAVFSAMKDLPTAILVSEILAKPKALRNRQ